MPPVASSYVQLFAEASFYGVQGTGRDMFVFRGCLQSFQQHYHGSLVGAVQAAVQQSRGSLKLGRKRDFEIMMSDVAKTMRRTSTSLSSRPRLRDVACLL